MKKRNVAYKVWISQLLNNKYVKQEGEFESDYIELNFKKISRVNIIATVVGKFASDDGNYSSITLDDGSSQIRVKAWREDTKRIAGINQGDLVLALGRMREYNNEIYMIPDLVKPIKDMNWELARKLELLKEHGFVKKIETFGSMPKNIVEETKKEYSEEKIDLSSPASNDLRTAVLDVINKLATSDGISINEIIRQLGISSEEADNAINELVRDGEIYKSRPGIVNMV